MEIDLLLLALGAALCVVVRGVVLFRANLNGRAFCAQIKKLVDAGNRERAIKLCRAVPQAAIVAVVQPMLEAMEGGFAREALIDAYDRARPIARARIALGSWLPYVAMACGAAAFSGELKADRGFGAPLAIVGASAVVLAFWQLIATSVQKRNLDRDGMDLRDYLLLKAGR